MMYHDPMDYSFIQENLWIFAVLALWEMIWKGVGLWKAGRNNQLGWFLAIFIMNTLGILPILYIYFIDRGGKSDS